MTLKEFFTQNDKVAIAFSGGVDSSYLLYVAKSMGCEINAYYVKTIFQPQFELEDAKRLTKELSVNLTVLELDVSDLVLENTDMRCYHCKKTIMNRIIETAKKDGFSILIDGANASDDADDRPGMKASKELNVLSPLRECGITKDAIRQLSKDAGLFVWDKPAYACLATRIPTNTPILEETLVSVEKSEAFLKMLGFLDFRIRVMGDMAKLQVTEDQLLLALKLREAILEYLSQYFKDVLLDLKAR